MVTENGCLAEVTKAAERMGPLGRNEDKPKSLPQNTSFTEEQHRGRPVFPLWIS
jgi:hypothetical protein